MATSSVSFKLAALKFILVFLGLVKTLEKLKTVCKLREQHSAGAELQKVLFSLLLIEPLLIKFMENTTENEIASFLSHNLGRENNFLGAGDIQHYLFYRATKILQNNLSQGDHLTQVFKALASGCQF